MSNNTLYEVYITKNNIIYEHNIPSDLVSTPKLLQACKATKRPFFINLKRQPEKSIRNHNNNTTFLWVFSVKTFLTQVESTCTKPLHLLYI